MSEKVTILYVDDEPTNLILFEINFRKKYNILSAESGTEGLNKLKGNTDIIIVISDMNMPGMNGLEFIQEAKESHEFVAYFILSGYDMNDEIKRALDSKLILEYFTKPFNKNKIEKAIEDYINAVK